MSCDDKPPVMPPVVPRPSSSGQTLQGAVLYQLLTQQPSPSPLLPWAPQTPQTSKIPTPTGWTSMLEWLYEEVHSQWGRTAVPLSCTHTHSTESHESRGSTESKRKVHPSGDVSIKPPKKQQHCSCSDDTVFIMMDSPAEASSAPMAEESPTPSLEKVTPSLSQG